eukprot:gene12147-16264_t
MNRANHKNLAQSINLNLIGIRNAEINYFGSFFTSFGTQSAVMVGMVSFMISQVPALTSTANYWWITCYWISTALCFSFALHVLVCTTFLTVFGQGLAIRGPVGSMVKAIDGMIIEQKHIVRSFGMTIIFFTLQCMGLWWIIMDYYSALSCFTLLTIGTTYWYTYGIRIYNRFKYNSNDSTTWDDNKERNSDNPLLLSNSNNSIQKLGTILKRNSLFKNNNKKKSNKNNDLSQKLLVFSEDNEYNNDEYDEKSTRKSLISFRKSISKKGLFSNRKSKNNYHTNYVSYDNNNDIIRDSKVELELSVKEKEFRSSLLPPRMSIIDNSRP